MNARLPVSPLVVSARDVCSRFARFGSRCLPVFSLVVALLSVVVPLPAQSGGATIEGTVLNATSGTYLNNARIVVEGSRLETFSDANGQYRLAGVPAGAVRLHVSYTGMEAKTATVMVTGTAAARQDFELSIPRNQTTLSEKDVVKMENFVVESTALSAAAAAVNEQKTSPNIKNVVVLDEIGDLGDGNIGEYLKYTPGISIVGAPQTAGSASIRGLPAGGIVFMIDGAEVSTPSLDRGFDLAASSSGSVDRIEVTKVPTPDRPANAVGGTVNIVGKSGFASPRRYLRLNTYLAYNSDDRLNAPGLRERLGSDSTSSARAHQPGVDLSYSHPVNKQFAFTVNLSQLTRVYDMDYDSPTWDLVRGVQTTSTLQNVLQATERQLASTTFDWRPTGRDSLRLNIEHVNINTPTRQNIFAVAWGANNTGGATFTQGFQPAIATANGNDLARQTMTYGDRTRGTTSAVLRYLHDGPRYKFDAIATYSRSWDKRKDIENGFFRTVGTFQVTGLVVRAENLDGIYDRFAPRYTATRNGQAFDLFDGNNLTLLNPTSQPEQLANDMRALSANLSRSFALAAPLTLKTGFNINRQRRDRQSELRTWTFAPPATVSRLARDHNLINDGLSRQRFFNDTLQLRWISPSKYYDLFKANPTWFTVNEAAAYQSAAASSRFFQETVSAAYAMGSVKFLQNRLWLVAGVRFEKTDDRGEGLKDDLRATYRQDAQGNLIRDANNRPIVVTTDALASNKLRYTARGALADRTYDGYYPSFNSTYYVTDELVARAAYAKTLGRPALSEVVPGITVSDPTVAQPSATVVNSGLQPWSADNFDLSFESYNLKGATIAVSLFRKDLKDFFVTTQSPATLPLLESFGLNDDYLGYIINTKTNGGEATVKGYELSWRQSWWFLPAWAKGFSTFANATISRVSGPNERDFTPFAHKNINWGASYTRRSFTFRWNVAYAYKVTGAAVAASATVPAGTFSYVAPQVTQDWSFDWRFAKRFTFYGGARNWNGANKRTERAGPGTPAWTRPQSYQNFGTLVTVGVRSEF
ncbi:MAG: TonB-dependent receptor [Verrucomicrobia bacterium]|nr:TonB-dependent receptor [Verrucomicrobiota bacterium]